MVASGTSKLMGVRVRRIILSETIGRGGSRCWVEIAEQPLGRVMIPFLYEVYYWRLLDRPQLRAIAIPDPPKTMSTVSLLQPRPSTYGCATNHFVRSKTSAPSISITKGVTGSRSSRRTRQPINAWRKRSGAGSPFLGDCGRLRQQVNEKDQQL